MSLITLAPEPTQPLIQVRGLYDLNQHMADEADFVFSITDSPEISLPFTPARGKVLRMFFEDTERPTAEEWKAMRQAVTSSLVVAKSKAFGPEHRLVVHCHAGISRSSALAWAILVQMGLDIEQAFQVLWKARPVIWPNRAVLDIADHHLGLEGRLLAFGNKVHEEIEEQHNQTGYCS